MLTRFLVLTAATLMMSACAYVADKPTQKLTIVTPGAYNAKCLVSAGGSIKYTYWPPETMVIGKSEGDLVIDCNAPGNRSKKVVISPDISKAVAANVVNGVVPGLAWDYTSKSMYNYPEYVEVDFTHMPATPYPLPAQNQPDIKQPEEYDLEEFSPGVPRLNEDRHAPQIEIRKRQPSSEFGIEAPQAASAATEGQESKLLVIKDAPATKTLNEASESGSINHVLGKLGASPATEKSAATTAPSHMQDRPATTSRRSGEAGAPVSLLPSDKPVFSNITFE